MLEPPVNLSALCWDLKCWNKLLCCEQSTAANCLLLCCCCNAVLLVAIFWVWVRVLRPGIGPIQQHPYNSLFKMSLKDHFQFIEISFSYHISFLCTFFCEVYGKVLSWSNFIISPLCAPLLLSLLFIFPLLFAVRCVEVLLKGKRDTLHFPSLILSPAGFQPMQTQHALCTWQSVCITKQSAISKLIWLGMQLTETQYCVKITKTLSG